ncbi:hypothetical protein BR93DRAFT_971230 [Coniochaeta sp. PMI_546]|nr:hypothetical protein BR93DRAFT_971230 [Coniochaeta sp. PMI_546]
MVPDDLKRAEEARQRGNELYKQGNLRGAEDHVKFEQGNYSESIRYIEDALNLAKHRTIDEAANRREKALYARLVKCYMHVGQFDKAREVIPLLSDQELKNSDVAEYYAIGHDEFQSLYDHELEQSSSAGDSLSFMFCGSGDARHLFTTLLTMQVNEMMGRTKVCKNLHITILDLKPAALARTLIFIDMLLVYAIMKMRKTPGIEDAPTVMAYLYVGHVIPAAVNEKLQTQIKGLIDSLEAGEPLFDWLFVPAATAKQVVRCLRQWQGPLEAPCYRAKTVRKAVGDRLEMNREQQKAMLGRLLVSTPQGMEQDRKSLDDLTVLLPSRGFAERRDSALVPLMMRYEKGSRDAIKELGDHIDANWVTNPTLIDVDYSERTRAEQEPWLHSATVEDMVPAMESDPIELAVKLPTFGTGTTVLDAVGKFFDGVSMALVTLSERMKIEALVGEMSDVMERIRWDCLEARSKPSGGIDPSKFPRKYDRIHMSNIPDYVGGLLTAAIKRITDHFSLTRRANDGAPKGPGGFMREGYMVWDRAPARKLTDKNLLPRPALEKWLYAHFLKICLPYPRERFSDRPVHAPLNLTAFLRLVSQLSERGYPSHCYLPEADVDAVHPAIKMTVAPWRAEFTTLLSIWGRLLPFGFIAPPGALAQPRGIAEYSVSFPKFLEEQTRIPHFVLLFWDSQAGDIPGMGRMRRFLLDDEAGDTSERARDIKHRGVHVFSTFEFVTDTRTASFWCRADTMREMMGGDWKVFIWRTDTWERVTQGVSVKDVRLLRTWDQ